LKTTKAQTNTINFGSGFLSDSFGSSLLLPEIIIEYQNTRPQAGLAKIRQQTFDFLKNNISIN